MVAFKSSKSSNIVAYFARTTVTILKWIKTSPMGGRGDEVDGFAIKWLLFLKCVFFERVLCLM